MSAALETLEQYGNTDRVRVSKIALAFDRLFGDIFGCQHREMSRPFSRQGETYRVCITCGARRQFDEKTWNSSGRHYHKPARTCDLLDIDTSALRKIPATRLVNARH